MFSTLYFFFARNSVHFILPLFYSVSVRLHHGLDRARKEVGTGKSPAAVASDTPDRLSVARQRLGCPGGWAQLGKQMWQVRSPQPSTESQRKPAGKASACHLRVRLPFPVQVHAPHLSLLPRLHPLPTRPLPAGQQASRGRQRAAGSPARTEQRVFFPSPHGDPSRPRSGRPPSGLRPSSAGSRGGYPASLVSSLPSSAPLCAPVGSVVRLRRGFVSGTGCLEAFMLFCRLRRGILESECRSATGCLAIYFCFLFGFLPNPICMSGTRQGRETA